MTKIKFYFIKKLLSYICLSIIFWITSIVGSYSQESGQQNRSALKMKAEKVALNNENGILKFSGNVEILYKEYKIKSDFLKATQNKNKKQISLIEASGNVYISNNKDIRASGDALTFNVKDQFILIQGNVKFEQGDSVIKGKRVYIDLLTEISINPIDFNSENVKKVTFYQAFIAYSKELYSASTALSFMFKQDSEILFCIIGSI